VSKQAKSQGNSGKEPKLHQVTEWRKKNLGRNQAHSGASSTLAIKRKVYDYDSGNTTGQKIGSEYLQYLSSSIWLEVGVITPVWRQYWTVCWGVHEAFTGLMRMALQGCVVVVSRHRCPANISEHYTRLFYIPGSDPCLFAVPCLLSATCLNPCLVLFMILDFISHPCLLISVFCLFDHSRLKHCKWIWTSLTLYHRRLFHNKIQQPCITLPLRFHPMPPYWLFTSNSSWNWHCWLRS